MTPRYVTISRRGKIAIREPGGKIVGHSDKKGKAIASARHANVASGHGPKVRVVDNRPKKKRK